jgi:hypothetical protein
VLGVVHDEQHVEVLDMSHHRVEQRTAWLLTNAEDIGEHPDCRLVVRRRVQFDEPDTVAVAEQTLVRELQGEARLPRPTRSDERDEPMLVELLVQSGELLRPADERRRRNGHIVAEYVDPTHRGEVAGKALAEQLEDVDLGREILQAMRPEVEDVDVVRQRRPGRLESRRGDEDLLTGGRGLDSRRGVDREADIVVCVDGGRAGVQTHPHLYRRVR